MKIKTLTHTQKASFHTQIKTHTHLCRERNKEEYNKGRMKGGGGRRKTLIY